MICKYCGKKNHYCGGCDYDEYMSNGYCNKTCQQSDKPYKEWLSEANDLIKSFTYAQLRTIYEVLDNEISELDFYNLIEDAIKEHDNRGPIRYGS